MAFFFNFISVYNFFLFSAQIKMTVQGLFDLNQNIAAFKEHLRDFMVQIKVTIAVTSFKVLLFSATVLCKSNANKFC